MCAYHTTSKRLRRSRPQRDQPYTAGVLSITDDGLIASLMCCCSGCQCSFPPYAGPACEKECPSAGVNTTINIKMKEEETLIHVEKLSKSNPAAWLDYWNLIKNMPNMSTKVFTRPGVVSLSHLITVLPSLLKLHCAVNHSHAMLRRRRLPSCAWTLRVQQWQAGTCLPVRLPQGPKLRQSSMQWYCTWKLYME